MLPKFCRFQVPIKKNKGSYCCTPVSYNKRRCWNVKAGLLSINQAPFRQFSIAAQTPFGDCSTSLMNICLRISRPRVFGADEHGQNASAWIVFEAKPQVAPKKQIIVTKYMPEVWQCSVNLVQRQTWRNSTHLFHIPKWSVSVSQN